VIAIRSAGPDDVVTVLAFWLRNAEPTSTDDVAAVASAVDNPACDVLIAEDDGVLIGTVIASWDGWRGNLYRLAVSMSRRREGIGRALIAAAELSLLARGARRVSAIVIDDHDYAVRTWRDSGYERESGQGRYVKMLG
jgi:ribosomal protein S18 acetylase RimI-like enzyme